MDEAWVWERIQSEPCPECGQCPAAVAVSRLATLAVDAADGWRVVLATHDDPRRRPAPDVWSPLEYGLHVRDMFEVFGGRMVAAAEQDDPVFDWSIHDPEGTYNQTDLDDAARQIDAAAERFTRVLRQLTPEQHGRTGRRRGPAGTDVVDTFTVAGLACFAIHEAHHHRLDATGAFA